MKNANSFIADELANKNQYLTKALFQANEIIQILEQENIRLKDVLTSLASINNRDSEYDLGVNNDKFCTV